SPLRVSGPVHRELPPGAPAAPAVTAAPAYKRFNERFLKPSRHNCSRDCFLTPHLLDFSNNDGGRQNHLCV
ncbi:jg3, partial [Pararge aegeria aegeria]